MCCKRVARAKAPYRLSIRTHSSRTRKKLHKTFPRVGHCARDAAESKAKYIGQREEGTGVGKMRKLQGRLERELDEVDLGPLELLGSGLQAYCASVRRERQPESE